jgi:hypothetical protein
MVVFVESVDIRESATRASSLRFAPLAQLFGLRFMRHRLSTGGGPGDPY